VEEFVAGVESGSGPIELAVHNIGANVHFEVADTTPRVYQKTWELAALSALHFSRALGPRMAKRGRGTIIFTGATSSLRGSAGFSAFPGAMAAKRMLAQSLARELGPSGVHVAHVVLDGPVDTAFVAGLLGQEKYLDLKTRGALIEPDAVARAYWSVHEQPPSAWTHEMELRPFCEKW
jgi:NAD(P)-dependent dehydrogenase (short-subunit alcohol dehydrogenase family)